MAHAISNRPRGSLQLLGPFLWIPPGNAPAQAAASLDPHRAPRIPKHALGIGPQPKQVLAEEIR